MKGGHYCPAEELIVTDQTCLETSWTYHEEYGWVMLADCEDCKWLKEKPGGKTNEG